MSPEVSQESIGITEKFWMSIMIISLGRILCGECFRCRRCDSESTGDMKSFEVVYYLNLCLPEFVVPKDKVDAALHVPWRREMPVMIAYDTTIARPRKCWHSGRLLNDIDPKNDMINLPDYRWRLLQFLQLF
ncbi:uncharacterized protein LOC130805685 isoform X2 [Amaranthus tricolor]|uniref:uncharacterized protein LOC130805685 isoform X2 n=1 Tax=Amaranthus tricolor TaxID=29722 RepID=UPI002588C721|nr:uncharacterized protein LOC130805685 isoform X2 [Amaranthus tricolor]